MVGILVMILVCGSAAGLLAGYLLDYSNDSDGVVEISLSNQGLRFTADEIIVPKGATVRLTFKIANGMHDWVLDEFGAATEVMRTGNSQTIEFVAGEAGTFEYYCSVGNHRQAGMTGDFVVVG